MFEIEKYIQIHTAIVLNSPQVLQDKIMSYKNKLHELVTLFTPIKEKYDRYINNYLLNRYTDALADIYTLFMTWKESCKSDFLISATPKFLEANQDIPEKELIVQKMEEAKELVREIFSLIDN
ncbi:hypothetical protein IC235_14795 [Hymenobacter sp. BT664]|uniref:Uncharacterized protein n=1 Tax=Hymenobacter montanus TaxID=2771359 RepID=A0A927BFP1_9BACT|nr:hypothetical protein [Hymenobacter montanus]MBD2769157.1 hypothetical protein [Hymenobacter montanus]